MIRTYSNLLTPEECNMLYEDMFYAIKRNRDETNSLGYCQVLANTLVYKFDETVRKDFPKKYKFTHSYSRIYFKDSVLDFHVDRKHLDLTLSVHIKNNLNFDWPLVFSTKKLDHKKHLRGDKLKISKKEEEEYRKDSISFITKQGEGVAGEARFYPHWRDKLECGEDQYYMQIFYHWMEIK